MKVQKEKSYFIFVLSQYLMATTCCRRGLTFGAFDNLLKSTFDFFKNFCYNIYTIKKGI